MKLILSSILLGFGGFDPMGALIVMTALAHGATKTSVYLFALLALLSTTLFGTLFASGIGVGTDRLSGLASNIPDEAYALIELVLAAALVTWLIRRLFFKRRVEKQEGRKESRFMRFAKKSMPLAGFLFAFWAMSDPTFWAVVALSARDGGLGLRMLCSAIWMVLGQLPLYVLTLAVAGGAHERLIEKVDGFLDHKGRRERLRRGAQVVIDACVALLAAFFLVDGAAYLVTGYWL